jgi:leucine dehydrogenase
MDVFEHPEFDSHEQVVFFRVAEAGLKAIVAIHSCVRGPALGGCRMYPYASEMDALTDVLRLSRGMTYKSAISGLPLGGGKAVIIGDPRHDKSVELFEAFGRCLEHLGGRYIVAEDSGTSVEDLRIIAAHTRHVSGIGERPMSDGSIATGDPSPATAYGVLKGIEAAVRHVYGKNDLAGLKVAVQGAGNVGSRLVRHLTEAGAKVWICDVYPDRAAAVVERFGAKAVPTDGIFELQVDVLSPCALGAVLNDASIPKIKARIVAGAANNQLAESRHALALQEKGICYVPDFAINAGGVIDIAGYQAGLSYKAGMQEVAKIYQTILMILNAARTGSRLPVEVAEEMARMNLSV